MFRKVLIANRGEIAVRIARTLREMDIRSIAVYSDADRGSLHVRMADEAVHIGPSPSSESYLGIARILDAARMHGADAIHPGYGFLSENADFAAACETAGIVFVGPSVQSIRKMGSKTEARRLALAAGTPIVPGTEEGVSDLDGARRIANAIGYPVMLKAVAGGGGKGMRLVDREADLDSAFREASSEAGRAFANPEIYIEKLICDPRHIEIQLVGDAYGNIVHLGERECSIQRRHQKIIEECPSPLTATHPEIRSQMAQAAIRVAKAAGYWNAGTVEFLVDRDRNFYFLEMNTRLQVEHLVTELVIGLDLVRLQIEIAAGQKLALTQDQIEWRGAAIECRVYAEDPENDFFPSPGNITRLDVPAGPGIRLDSGVYAGWTVPIDYDPLIAKLAAWTGTRKAVIERMIRALDEFHVGGIKTNLSFLRQIVDDTEFRNGNLHTGFLEHWVAPQKETSPDLEVVAALAKICSRRPLTQPAPSSPSGWLTEGRTTLLR